MSTGWGQAKPLFIPAVQRAYIIVKVGKHLNSVLLYQNKSRAQWKWVWRDKGARERGVTPEMSLKVGSLVLQEQKDPECFVPGALMGRPQGKRMQVEDRSEENGRVLEHVGWPGEWRSTVLPHGCLR